MFETGGARALMFTNNNLLFHKDQPQFQSLFTYFSEWLYSKQDLMTTPEKDDMIIINSMTKEVPEMLHKSAP